MDNDTRQYIRQLEQRIAQLEASARLAPTRQPVPSVSAISSPSRKYDVLTAIDDTLEPIWTTMRVQE